MGPLTRLFARLRGNSPPGHQANTSPLMSYVDRSQLWSADRLLRLGTRYGGWEIPRESGLTQESVCYLAGAGEDISFDCELAARFHCQVRVLDPTPRAVQHFEQLRRAVREGTSFPINNSRTEFYHLTAVDLDRLIFLPVGLAGQDGELKFYMPRNPAHVSCSTVNLQKTSEFFTAPCHRLNSLMAQLGDTRLDLLKMDIEGAEYSVIQELLNSHLLPKLLLIEFDEAHTPLDDNAGARIRDHIQRLSLVGMQCIAVDGSNATFVGRGGAAGGDSGDRVPQQYDIERSAAHRGRVPPGS
jgi:FkbM family methyltransferase